MTGYKSITGNDQRNMPPPKEGGTNNTLSTVAKEQFATGKNALKEHMGDKGKSFGPGKTQGHGG